MTTSALATSRLARQAGRIGLALIVPALIVAAWAAVPLFVKVPAYKLPTVAEIGAQFWALTFSGKLGWELLASGGRFIVGLLLGTALALPLGLAIALNRHVSDVVRPVLVFFQAIAGIAWVPMAIIWFGFGQGPVIFVIANTVFFSTIYNVVRGVESIPAVLRNAVRSMGGKGIGYFRELILPGALVQIIVGLRTSMAFGLRALVGAEMIAGTSGLGFMTIDASQSYGTDTVIVGMLVIAVVWYVLDRAVFIPLERKTVVRWGLQRSQ